MTCGFPVTLTFVAVVGGNSGVLSARAWSAADVRDAECVQGGAGVGVGCGGDRFQR